MITLGVGAGEGTAPVQEGCLFDMIALGVDAGGWGGGRRQRLSERSACLT